MKIIALVFLILVIVVVGIAISLYNKLVRARNQAFNSFAQIDVQLKRRHDLIPNLVEVSKSYLEHERDTLTQVMDARNQAEKLQSQNNHAPDSAAHMTMFAQAEGLLTKALGQFKAVAEDYPELKADSVVQELTQELTNTENRIGFARQHYNDSVMYYNNEREVFPNNLISNAFNFGLLSELRFADKAAIDQAPRVNMTRSTHTNADTHPRLESTTSATINPTIDPTLGR